MHILRNGDLQLDPFDLLPGVQKPSTLDDFIEDAEIAGFYAKSLDFDVYFQDETGEIREIERGTRCFDGED